MEALDKLPKYTNWKKHAWNILAMLKGWFIKCYLFYAKKINTFNTTDA